MNSPASLNWQLTVECVGFVAEITVKKQIKRTVGFDEVNSSVKESMKTWIKDSMDDLLVEKEDEAGNDRQRRQRRGRQQTIEKPGSKNSGSKKQQRSQSLGVSAKYLLGPFAQEAKDAALAASEDPVTYDIDPRCCLRLHVVLLFYDVTEYEAHN